MDYLAGACAAQGEWAVVRDAGPPCHQHSPSDDHPHRGLHPGDNDPSLL